MANKKRPAHRRRKGRKHLRFDRDGVILTIALCIMLIVCLVVVAFWIALPTLQSLYRL